MPATTRKRGAPRGAGRLAAVTLTVLRALVAGPQTIAEMAERVGLDLRTAHRWIGYLDRAGISVRQLPTWPVQYHVDLLDLMRWIGEARTAPPPKRKRPR